jgi:amino acid transporter
MLPAGKDRTEDASSGAAPGEGGSELPRVLGPLSAASILIGCIIGSGVFRKPGGTSDGPGGIAEVLPSPGWILVCWAAAGALSLIGSLVFAELGSYYPRAGGQYTYIRESFGKLPAFLFGWTNLLIINSASIAALAVISTEYLFNVLPEGLHPAPGSHWFQTMPLLMIVFLTAANALGVRWGAAIQNTLTVLKLAALGLIIFGIFIPGRAEWSNLSPFWEIRGKTDMDAIFSGFQKAFLAILWAYDGWYLLSFSGGEIRNPRRNIPIGFILGILVVAGVYLATNLSYFSVLSLEEMKNVSRQGGVGAEAAYRLYGAAGLTLISIGIVASTFGAANGNILTGPRLSFAMARDGLFFGRFGIVHARYLTPFFAIVVQGALAAIYIYAGTFDQLTDSVVFAAWIFYLLTMLGFFRLRARNRQVEGAFRAPGCPLLPVIFIAFAVAFVGYSLYDSFLLARAFVEDPSDRNANGLYILVSTAIILAGIPAYWLAWRRRRGPR